MTRKYLTLGMALCACIAAAGILSGCGVLSRPAPLQIVVLNNYKAGASSCGEKIPAQILVPTPYASAGLNTDRIAILKDNREVHYISGYRWEANNAHMMQRMLVDAINDSGCFTGAGTGSMSLHADYRLEIDIKLMHFIYEKNQKDRSAEVSMLLRLVKVSSGTMIGQHHAYAQKPCGDNIFDAMEEAVHESIGSSLGWLRESIAAGE